MPNVSHENHLIFMRMTAQVIYIFIPIVSLKDSFCHRGKSKLGIGLFIHELLREPLLKGRRVQPRSQDGKTRDPGNEVEESHVSQTNRVFLKARFTTAPRFLFLSVSRPKLPRPIVFTGCCHHQPITGHFSALFVISPPQEGFVKLAN